MKHVIIMETNIPQNPNVDILKIGVKLNCTYILI